MILRPHRHKDKSEGKTAQNCKTKRNFSHNSLLELLPRLALRCESVADLSQNATELVFHSRAPWPPSRGHGLFEVIFNHIGDLRFPTTTPSGAEPFAELSVPSTRSARTRKGQRETHHSGEASGVPLGIIRNLQACAQSGCEVSLKRRELLLGLSKERPPIALMNMVLE